MTITGTQICISNQVNSRRVSLRGSLATIMGGALAIGDTLLGWQERARQRRALLTLGDRALQDFGASLADARTEGDKPFWRP